MSRAFLRASLVVAVLTMVAKLVTLVREVVVAGQFGVGDAMDIFVAAFVPISIGANLISSFSAALVPAYIARLRKHSERDANALVGEVVWPMLGVLALLTLIAFLASDLIVRVLAPGFEPAKQSDAVHLFRLMIPVLPLAGLGAICSGVLNARDRFAAVAAAPMLIPLSVLLVVLVKRGDVSIAAVAWATDGGFALQCLLLLAQVRAAGISLRPGPLRRLSEDARRVMREYAPMVSSTLLLSGTALVDQIFTSGLPDGSVSALSYGTRLTAQLTGVATVTVGTVLLPRISRMVADGRLQELRREMRRGTGLIALISIPAMLVLVALSRPIVRLMYERGAMGPDAAELVAVTQAMSFLQVPFVLLGAVFVRVLLALQLSRILLVGNVISVIVNLALDLLLMRWLGVAGIALASSLVYVVACAFLAAMSYRAISRRLESEVRTTRLPPPANS